MACEPLSLEAARLVTPRALTGYARGLGWKPAADGRRAEVAVFHRPDSHLHQVIIPTDPTLSDYGEAVAEAVRKLAAFEQRPAREVLEHLLLPPADVLRIREDSPDAEAGSLPLERAVRMINGTRQLLLSAAHSVLAPQAYHPRLSRSEAVEFLARCRLGQTERGSYALNVACPLDLPVSLAGVEAKPFGRRVVELLLDSLGALAGAGETARADSLLDPAQTPGMSADLCEALLLLRPESERAWLVVSVWWSRVLLPASRDGERVVELRGEAFEVAAALAPRLRSGPQPSRSRFIGYVDGLSGQPTRQNPRPSGEVDFTLFDDEQGEIRARGTLSAEDYAVAAAAHLASDAVAFKATLRRLPRLSRIEDITEFERVGFHEDKTTAPESLAS